MAYDEQLANRIRQAFGTRSDITERKMFGGLAFLCRVRMCCGIVAIGERSGLTGFSPDDLLRDAPKIRSRDVRLRTERIEDLSRSRDEGCGTSGTERADDIPRMRGHES